MFKKKYLFLSFVFIWAGFIPLVWAGDRDPGRFMSVNEIKPGMKGYGLTVFSGTRIDTFDVEILGVMMGVTPKGDLILARMGGGPLEKTGIYGGMSGSPIYIDGRLIGAAAYGWYYAKEPIGGITPIGEMLDVWTRPVGSQEQQGSRTLPGSLNQDQQSIDEIPIPEELMIQSGLATAASKAFLRQWTAPVAISGFDDRLIELMAPAFEPYGLVPVQGGGAAAEEGEISLQPGSTVAAQLISGDASVSVVGTLTYREGDRVLAFGHPMYRAGSIDLPMTGGIVHLVFPSQERSFKMTSTTRPVGSFQQDRRAGTAGLIGGRAELIPCTIHVGHGQSNVLEIYHYELAHDRIFTPSLVGWVTANSLAATERLQGRSSLRIHTDIRLQQHGAVALENVYAGDMTLLQAAADAAAPVSLLMDNPFERIHVEGIDISVESEETMRTATLDAVHVDKLAVRPGDTINVTVLIRPHQGSITSLQAKLTIPEDAPDGGAQILVADAKTARAFEKSRAPSTFRPQSLDQLLGFLQDVEKHNEVYVVVYQLAQGIAVNGEELPSPPHSLLSVMSSSRSRGDVGPTKASIVSEQHLVTDYVVTGSIATDIAINKRAR